MDIPNDPHLSKTSNEQISKKLADSHEQARTMTKIIIPE